MARTPRTMVVRVIVSIGRCNRLGTVNRWVQMPMMTTAGQPMEGIPERKDERIDAQQHPPDRSLSTGPTHHPWTPFPLAAFASKARYAHNKSRRNTESRPYRHWKRIRKPRS